MTETENHLAKLQMDEIVSKMEGDSVSFPMFCEYRENHVKDFLMSQCPDKKFSINAQKLYDETYVAMYRFFPQSSDQSQTAKYACAEHSMEGLFKEVIGLNDEEFNQIFSEMISLKDKKIKELKENVTEVYHYSQVDNLRIIQAFEQPVGNNLRTNVGKKAVYASPDKISIYPLKAPRNKNSRGTAIFNHQHQIGYIIYGQNSTFKSPEDFIDQLKPSYRYTLDAQDFYPCVSLSGIYSGEWEAYKDATAKKEEGPFTIEDVMKFGYKLYFAPEEHKSDLEKIRRNAQSREDLIQNLDEACKDVNFGLINYSNSPYLQERAQKHYEILLKQKELHHKIKEAENIQKQNKESGTQIMLTKTGRPLRRKMPRVSKETKKELQKTGLFYRLTHRKGRE